nr:hypothetical protein CFP56_77528 [Quercus suber]
MRGPSTGLPCPAQKVSFEKTANQFEHFGRASSPQHYCTRMDTFLASRDAAAGVQSAGASQSLSPCRSLAIRGPRVHEC